jgi:outer membrane protein TolC
MDILLGNRPGISNTKIDQIPFPGDLPPIPTTFPPALLDNRPDLKASEFRIHAAKANVAIAVSDLYPDIGISGNLSLSSSKFRDLFDLDQLVGSLASSLIQPVFSGGSLKANVRLQESAMRELAIAYESQVLEAIREVESSLQAEQRLEQRLESQQRSMAALREAETIAGKRYKDGLQSLQSFLEVQQRRYLSEQNALLTNQALWSNRIDLYLALGGKVPSVS